MKKVWNELLRRKRQDYERTEAFVPASQTSWTSQATSERRQAVKLRKLGGRENEVEAVRLEFFLAAVAEVIGVGMLFPWWKGRAELPRQELAVAYFFHQAFALAQRNPRPVPLPEARKARRPYLEMATQLRADHFWEASFAYEALADAAAPPPGSPLLVKRQHRSDERMQGFVMALAATTKRVFGAPLCGTVATAANVALGRDDLTAETVRKMPPRALPP